MSIVLSALTRPEALILAAGVGRRLGQSMTGFREPKAMLRFAGQSLMSRHINTLRSLGIVKITVVVGFEADHLRAAIAALEVDPPIEIVVNPDFREGSVISLWAGRNVLRGGRPIVLMDADVLYDRRLLARLIESTHPECLLLDREIEPGDEPVKLCIRGGRIVDFHKKPTVTHEWYGESVGFFRFSPQTAAELADRAGAYVTSGRRAMEYEEPVRDMMITSKPGRFNFEDISGLPWTEIDFPEDIVKANALLPSLVA